MTQASAAYEQAWSSSEGADLYERARPAYAPSAVAFAVEELGVRHGSRVVDLAAGTGKLTRQLVDTGADLLAVEPLEGMRGAFTRVLPGVPVVEGYAEVLPLPGNSIDAVFAGQAWHWFDSAKALAEVTRVVIPGGGLALLWNDYDTRVSWVRQYAAIRRSAFAETLSLHFGDWKQAFTERDDWTRVVREVFRHTTRVSRQGVVERMLSSSAVAVQSSIARDGVASRIQTLLDQNEETRDRDKIEIPYQTQVFVTRYQPVRTRGAVGQTPQDQSQRPPSKPTPKVDCASATVRLRREE